MTALPLPLPDPGEGERRRDAGAELARRRRERDAAALQLALLDRLAAAPDIPVSTDDLTPNLGASYRADGGGQWRGGAVLALAAAGLIRRAGVVRSRRPARHAGYLAAWVAADRGAIDTERVRLRRLLDAPTPDLDADAGGHQLTLWD